MNKRKGLFIPSESEKTQYKISVADPRIHRGVENDLQRTGDVNLLSLAIFSWKLYVHDNAKNRGERGVQGMPALNPPMNMSNRRRGKVDG